MAVKKQEEKGGKRMKEMMEKTLGKEEVTESGLLQDNRGVGVVEIILILVVLIALVLIFKEQLGNIITKAMQALEKSVNEVLS